MALMIEGLRHNKTGKLFVLLEVLNPPTKMRVVSPAGEVMSLPEGFFGDEPEEFVDDAARSAFTLEQIAAMQRWLDERAIQEAAERQRPSHAPTRLNSSSDTPRPRRQSKSKPKPPAGPGYLRSEWNGTRLCFYKNKVEALRPQDFFKVNVDGEGGYVMSRTDFEGSFNDVLLNAGYRQMGYFAYGDTPEKAKKFLKHPVGV